MFRDVSFWTLFYFLISLVFGIVILMEKKNPVKALAYLAAVFLLPFVGIGLYLLFGREYRKRKLFSRKGSIDTRHIEQWKSCDTLFSPSVSKEIVDSMKPFDKVSRILWSDDQSILSACNSAEILNNGEVFFPRLFDDIRNAKNHIHLEFFTIEEGLVANELGEMLRKKVEEGVAVRVIYDDIGSRSLPYSYVEKLLGYGVKIYPFMPVRFIRFTDKVNYRDHRKIVVIDGKIAYTGGINLSDRYDNRCENEMYWRDTQVRIIGEAVLSVQLRFLLNWQFVSKENLTVNKSFFPVIEEAGQLPVQIIADGPDYDQPGMIDMFSNACNLARKRICLVTPYFVPPEVIQRALMSAALSGVSVEIIIPFKGDSKSLDLANRAFVEDMLEAGVKIWFYKKGFVHSKTMVVDNFFSTVGTTNLDYRSFDIDFEINAVFYDKDMADQLINDFEEDKRDSIPVIMEEWKNRPWHRRFLESFAKLFGPVL